MACYHWFGGYPPLWYCNPPWYVSYSAPTDETKVLREENEKLLEENNELERMVEYEASLRQEIKTLKEENNFVWEENKRQHREKEQLKEEIKALEENRKLFFDKFKECLNEFGKTF